MHGRIKVKTSAQQQAEKEKERSQKLLQYNTAMQKALQKRNEKKFDDEALEITGELLLANPDLYTMWNFRKEILSFKKNSGAMTEFQAMICQELPFTENCLRINPKSYGSWQHRIWALEESPNSDWSNELRLCDKYLELDERNFHCWDYRHFVRCRANASLERELEFVNKKIYSNFSNYSSWHYRSKLLSLLYPDSEKLRPVQEEKLLQELDLVQNAAFTDPNDQSAWFYHRWLLGRGEVPLKLCFLYTNRENLVILAFNSAIKVSTVDSGVTVHLNDVVHSCDWHSDKAFGDASSVWFTELESNGIVYNANFKVAAKFACNGFVSQLQCQLPEGKNENWISNPSRYKEFNNPFTLATSSVLKRELDSCMQLQELEPTCKWPMLTTAILLRSLRCHQHKNKVWKILNDLLMVDPLRSGYYKDLNSKFAMEYAVELLDNDERELNLSGLNLTTIYHPEYLIHLKKLDLSKNCMRALVGFSCLKCLEVLILDDNSIENCDDIRGVCKLKYVSFQGNDISSLEVLRPLSECRALENLDLRRNPLLNLANYISEVCSILPLVKVLDGNTVQC